MFLIITIIILIAYLTYTYLTNYVKIETQYTSIDLNPIKAFFWKETKQGLLQQPLTISIHHSSPKGRCSRGEVTLRDN